MDDPQAINNYEMIPEYKPSYDVLGDVALRVQQTLIALQVYQEKMDEVKQVLPGLQIDGYWLKDIPVWWGGMKSPQFLADSTKRSVTFVLLSALNCQLYMLDDFLLTVAKKHYSLPPIGEDDKWFSEEIFTLTTGIDLNKLPHSDAVGDVRRICGNMRKMKKSASITIPEYFEFYQKLCIYLSEIAVKVSEKVHKDKNPAIGSGGKDGD